MKEELIQRIKACPTLPSMPAIAMQVLNLAQSAEVDLAEMAKLITQDPALSSKILKTVNSSFYGRPQHVSTISQSLVILGLQSVKTLVLGFSLVSGLKHNKPKTFDHMRYWKRSIYAATAAKTICGRSGIVQHEEAFLATLMADIGMLVLDQVVGERYGEICSSARTHSEIAALEQAHLGLTHAEVGGLLADTWKLPPVLAAPIAMHHSPESVTEPAVQKLAQVVQLAGSCADVFVEESAAIAIQEVRKACLQHHGLSEKDTDVLLAEIGGKTREVAKLFEINIGVTVDYEAILKRANEALIEITLQSQQQATVMAQKASVLAEQNQALKEAASTDALTGLGNRQRFDNFMSEQFALAKSTGTQLSLIMIDLDHFKKVNDTHGHPAGDAVLRAVAKMLRTTARAQDLACRYGGEEMALVLPTTSRSTAAATAEQVRRTIKAKPIVINDEGGTLPCTASIGVATFEPGSPMTSHSHLIKAADMALYNAKNSGRDCVKVFAIGKTQAA